MELNKAVLDCMQAVRRRLKQEMALDIRLSQPDAVSCMLLACRRSPSEQTRQLGLQLEQLSDEHPALAPAVEPVEAHAEPPLEPSVRIYRGQRIYA